MGSLLNRSLLLSEEQRVVLWACQLDAGTQRVAVEEEDDGFEHLILLRTISLGANAGDELHVVAVDSRNASPEHGPVPIAALRRSALPTIILSDLQLVSPVTFVLQSGAGPVCLTGKRITLQDDAV